MSYRSRRTCSCIRTSSIFTYHSQLWLIARSKAVLDAPPAPPRSMSPARAEKSQIHTMKILHAIEKSTHLLSLPTRFTQHTTFVIMVAVTTIAHLSACRYVLDGRDLKVARVRVRATMGARKAYEDIWPLGRWTYREVGIVACEMLSLNKAEGQYWYQRG